MTNKLESMWLISVLIFVLLMVGCQTPEDQIESNNLPNTTIVKDSEKPETEKVNLTKELNETEKCAISNGEWIRFRDSCVDSCEKARLSYNPSACGAAITWGCECGSDRCWNSSTESCEPNRNEEKFACVTDNDCVPAQCCHPRYTVNKDYAPNCSGISCTQNCGGPLDCLGGVPICINNTCRIKLSEEMQGFYEGSEIV